MPVQGSPVGNLRAASLLSGGAGQIPVSQQQNFNQGITRQQMHLQGQQQQLAERQQGASEYYQGAQENRLRQQLASDMQNAEKAMRFKYTELDANNQKSLMDFAIRRRANEIGAEANTIDWEKARLMADQAMFQFNNVPASQWAEMAARKGYIAQQGGIDRILQSDRFTHEEKMGFATYVYGKELAKEAVDNAIRQAGGTAAATFPYERGLIGAQGAEQRAGIAATGVEQRAGAEQGQRYGLQNMQVGQGNELQKMEYGTTLGMQGNRQEAINQDWLAARGVPRQVTTMREGATLERGTMQQAQTNDLQKIGYAGTVGNWAAGEQAGREMTGNMAANPETVQSWGQAYGQRYGSYYQFFLNQQLPSEVAQKKSDDQVWGEISRSGMPEPVKHMVWQQVLQIKAQTFGPGGQSPGKLPPGQGAYGVVTPQMQPGSGVSAGQVGRFLWNPYRGWLRNPQYPGDR